MNAHTVSALFSLFVLTQGADEKLLQLASKLGAKTLVKFVEDASLTNTLDGDGPFTVFAPTDKAFAALPSDVVDKLKADKDLLTQVLTYHVLNGKTLSTDLKNDIVVPTLDGNSKIRINIYGKKVYATGSEVILADQMATNGVIHVVNKVLYPIPSQNIVQKAASNPDLETLVYAVTRAKLIETLSGDQPFTVFAPNNAAFDKLPPGFFSDLLSNETQLVDVLTYHVLPQTVYSAGLANGMQVPTVEKKNVNVKIEGGKVMINDATVLAADISVTSGVVHVIDTVLVPPSGR